MKKRLIGAGLVLLLFGTLYITTKGTKKVDHSVKSEISTLSKYFLRLINRGEYGECRSMMSKDLSSVMTRSRLSRVFNPILEAKGPFSHFRVASVDSVTIDGKPFHLCKLKGIYEKGPLAFTVLVDSDLKVSGLFLK